VSSPESDDRVTGPDPHEDPATSAGASAGPSRTGHPAPSPEPTELDDLLEVEGLEGEGFETEFTLEALLADLERVTSERDSYLGLAQRTQAEFENFRKRASRQLTDEVARETGRLVEALLPVLDAFDYAAAHGQGGETDGPVGPLRDQLVALLGKEGLVRIDPSGEPFDPNEHDAVAHEPGDGGEPVVAESLRAGYRWQGRLLRPAMVRVKD
jgi:molecular chaperone GrpE